MSTTLPSKVPGQADAPSAVSVPPSDLFNRKVSPAIQKSLDAFRAALPELLKNKTPEQEWVAFCGTDLVCFGRTKTEAFQECLRRGLKRGTFIVWGIEPDALRDEFTTG